MTTEGEMYEEIRLPAHLEAASLIRRAQADGGFAAVVHRGDREAGILLVVLCENGTNSRLYERMPQVDGTRKWHLSQTQDNENKAAFGEYLQRRIEQDRDSWIIELDIAQGERFIGLAEPSR